MEPLLAIPFVGIDFANGGTELPKVVMLVFDGQYEKTKILACEVSWANTKGQRFGSLLLETIWSACTCSQDIKVFE